MNRPWKSPILSTHHRQPPFRYGAWHLMQQGAKPSSSTKVSATADRSISVLSGKKLESILILRATKHGTIYFGGMQTLAHPSACYVTALECTRVARHSDCSREIFDSKLSARPSALKFHHLLYNYAQQQHTRDRRTEALFFQREHCRHLTKQM